MNTKQATSPASSSKTRPYFLQGRSCGDCVLLAGLPEESPARGTLLRAIRGLAAGRAGTCTVLLAGVLALSEKYPEAAPTPAPKNDLLDTFVPVGWPGALSVSPSHPVAEFISRFEARARLHGGISCAQISRLDWGAGRAAGLAEAYPPEQCVALADAAVADLRELMQPAPPG